MANYKKPEDRASETVTFRLTLNERQLLSELATAEEKSLTDLIRFLLQKHAEQIGLDREAIAEKPIPAAKPSRPARAARPSTQPSQIPPVISPIEPYRYRMNPFRPRSVPEPPPVAVTFGDLVVQFRESFSTRAEGTQKELDETIVFLCNPLMGEPLITFDLPLAELTSAKLVNIRNTMKTMDIRVAQKNRHLTYLRMMLHWAVKQENIDLTLNPAMDLKPFTISEIPGSWPGRFFSSR